MRRFFLSFVVMIAMPASLSSAALSKTFDTNKDTIPPYSTEKPSFAKHITNTGLPATELLGSIGGNASTIAVSGTLAYAGEGAGLTIVDISHPEQPTRVSHLQLPFFPERLLVNGNYAYATSGSTLYIIDVSNPTFPILIKSFTAPDLILGFEISDDQAYVWFSDARDQRGSGLEILGISDPYNPSVLGIHQLFPGQYWAAMDISVVSNRAYMCAYGKFRVLDVTDPALVFWLGEFPAECNGPMKVIGNTAYLGVGSCSDIGCSGLGFTILDVSNPVQIKWKGTLDGLVPSSLAVEGTLVYLFYGGLWVIDVSDPSVPNIITTTAFQGYGYNLQVRDRTAYLATSAGVQIIDLHDLDHPIFEGTVVMPRATEALSIVDNLAYVSYSLTNTRNDRLAIIDVSIPFTPSVISSFELAGSATKFRVANGRAFVLTSHGVDMYLDIYDISTPRNPTLQCNFKLPDGQSASDLSIVDQYAYLATSGGLDILDVRSSVCPTLLSNLPGTLLRQVRVQNQLAYATTGSWDQSVGLQIVDVQDPSKPALIGQYTHDTNQVPMDLEVMNGIGYLANDVETLILDVSKPVSPTLVSAFPFPAYSIEVDGHFIYAATQSGVWLVDIHDLAHPQSWLHIFPFRAFDISMSGNKAYFVGPESGLTIMQINSEQVREIFFPVIAISQSSAKQDKITYPNQK